jgi:hypothetical protein
MRVKGCNYRDDQDAMRFTAEPVSPLPGHDRPFVNADDASPKGGRRACVVGIATPVSFADRPRAHVKIFGAQRQQATTEGMPTERMT